VSLILYGSLYPFQFHTLLDPAGRFRDLLATWRETSSLGDLLANVLLYLPFGLFAAKAFRGIASPLRIITAVLTGAGLSMSLEFAQRYDVGRISAMSDVYANSFGALLGALAGTALSTDFKPRLWQDLRRRPFSALLLSCWLAFWLFPYVPVIDAHKYWHAVRPLLNGPTPAFGDLLRHVASWLGVGALLESVWGPAAARKALPVLVAAVFCARIRIAEIELSRPEVIGGALTAAVWVTWLYGTKYRAPIVAAALAATVLFQALEPFQFLTAGRPFGWVPFLAFINGSIWNAVPSLMAKFSLYGTLVWSLALMGLRWTAATSATAVFVFVIHYLQRYLPGRSAEITDTLLVVMSGGLMKIVGGAEEELDGS
jgi:VanZ family protein